MLLGSALGDVELIQEPVNVQIDDDGTVVLTQEFGAELAQVSLDFVAIRELHMFLGLLIARQESLMRDKQWPTLNAYTRSMYKPGTEDASQ